MEGKKLFNEAKTLIVPGCKYVVAAKLGIFAWGVYWGEFPFGASPKRPSEELQLLALVHLLHFSALEGVTWFSSPVLVFLSDVGSLPSLLLCFKNFLKHV